MSVFILDKISKTFFSGKKQNDVLKNIDLVFPEKGLFSIVGKSGCGKSTLLNILMGIEKPTSGKVYFNGTDISKMNDKKFSAYHLSGVSIVFQHYNLFNNLTALDNVILPQLIAGKPKRLLVKKAEKLFASFGISKLIKRKVNNLSGGEKQRIAILRSLISEPSAILCDEPTGALDCKNSEEIMGILKEISKNKLVIMVSHNKDLVNKYSDHILTLKDGVIVENFDLKFNGNIIRNDTSKSHYSSKWTKMFLKLNLMKDLKKNTFSLIACILSFAAMFISVGFSQGSNSSQEEALNQNLAIGFATASESKFIEIEGSPLSYQKTTKPDIELIDKYFGNFLSIRCEENLSYFISNYPSCYIDDIKLNNFEMIPLYDPSLQNFGSEMIVEGCAPSGDFEDILINEEFDEYIGGDSLNKTILINNESTVNYQTGVSDQPFIKDVFNFSKKFRIVGIVHEFSFLNSPKIYYSYKGAKDYLKNTVMENTSNYLGETISYYDYLENSNNDDPVSSYSSFIFITDPSEYNSFFNVIETLVNEPLQVSSTALETKQTYSTFISSFSNTLVIFVVIAFAGINFILGMISLSTFLENRKNTAILTCLGARNSSIYDIHLLENYLVIFISFILSIFTSKFMAEKLNEIIYQKFSLKNLISIPFKSFYGTPYGLVLLLGSIAIICSAIFTLVPMMIYRHNSLSDELRDE